MRSFIRWTFTLLVMCLPISLGCGGNSGGVIEGDRQTFDDIAAEAARESEAAEAEANQ